MSEMAKTARKALKAKASRLAADPHKKVDSSTWTPPEALNTEAKTGMQPLTKRAYKRGGKVLKAHGEAAHQHAGRKPRKSGGKAMPWVDVLMNRNEKKANTYREDGDKHVGGYKKGGRTKHATRGSVPTPPDMPEDIRAMRNRSYAMTGDDITTSTGARKEDRCSGGRTQKKIGGPMMGRKAKVAAMLGARNAAAARGMPQGGMMRTAGAAPIAPPTLRPMKKGGRAHKMDGGPMMPASANVAPDNRNNIVPQNVMAFNPARSSIIGLKKGGKAEHPDVAEDKALIRKMVKPEARTGKKHGGETKWIQGAIKHPGSLHKALHVPAGEKIPAKKLEKAEHSSNPKLAKKARLAETLKHLHKEKGGGVFSGENYPHKVPGVVPGGRMARSTGGENPPTFNPDPHLSTIMDSLTENSWGKDSMSARNALLKNGWTDDKIKDYVHQQEKKDRLNRKHGGKTGKTHIAINIAPPQAGGMMPPQGGAMPPRPPMPAPAPAPMPAAPPPAAPMGGAPAGGAPAGLPPQLAGLLGRKRGGRTMHVIDHAAGGGLGRLEKIKAYGHKA